MQAQPRQLTPEEIAECNAAWLQPSILGQYGNLG
jgi:hypothetical protein